VPYRIEGFPEEIAEVPETAREWLIWRDKVLAFRELMHRYANEDPVKRAGILKLAAADPAFFMAVFGVLFDPKGEPDLHIDENGDLAVIDKPAAWYPWIPYPFQVETVRWYQDVRRHKHGSKGRGDGVVEKSRDMGITWTFCLIAAHSWLFDDDSTFGLISYKEDLVKDDSPKGMMYKVKSLLGIGRARIPERCYAPDTPYHMAPARLPDWLIPAGFDPKIHSHQLSLKHPTKTNQITGESTTSKSGIGDRQGAVFIDEGAKNDKLLDIWTGLAAVTHHRFVFSSADRQYGDDMFMLASKGRLADANPSLDGPSFLSLPYNLHPLRDGERWLEAERARFEGSDSAFRREYLIEWNADSSALVYPSAQNIVPGDFPYNPLAGGVTCTIDPGLRDPTAIQFYQFLPEEGGHQLFDAITLDIDSAEFLTPILMGWPPGHEMRLKPGYYEASGQGDIQEIMDLMWTLRSSGKTVKFVGDPYGDNAGGANAQSFYTTMYLTSRELNAKYPDLPPFSITVLTKYDEGARYHRARKEALTRMIPSIKFNNVPRVRYVVTALQEHRYKPYNQNHSVQNEPSTPIHDYTSHHAASAEYFAVSTKVGDFMSMPSLKPTKTTVRNQKKRQGYAWT